MMLVVALLPANQALAKEKPPFVAEVVSSAADQATGGDARLHIVVPKVTPFHQVEVLVNGVNQADRFDRIDGTQAAAPPAALAASDHLSAGRAASSPKRRFRHGRIRSILGL
jgi:hypothetical protein